MSDPLCNEVRSNIIEHVPAGQMCCDPIWEAAYARFETPQEEIAKFIKRLTRFRFQDFDRNSRVVEIFCGRGNGLVALEQLGFTQVEGVDLSDTLLKQYNGAAQLHLANCLELPFEDASYDIVIVQGGLHHLPNMPGDLDQCLAEVRRVLRPGGKFFVIEPWRTPFLTFAHFVTELSVMRKLYAKGDALAIMTEQERVTYEQWLGMPAEIRQTFSKHFKELQWQASWGKLAGIFGV
ncbi:class I SAM-dependent methyltransferase [Stieleria sp. JC731]|uniref:class I SAM-dependent methyltransferase n=1 Tax=Pirellulaceae TaxID=2691357 RepID=UPI001E44B7D4|nr:class I SAM-dependent methyltransferase [Stieleria sp. JC731]MCC9599656.1 class I SAM-dependent methyltransferase [Stieleria sp. JC731]